jgi:tetratricopeptide (TPR) repeat protein
MLRKGGGWMSDREIEIAEAERLAIKAVQLGKDDAVALSRAGNVLAYVVHNLDAGRLFIDRALALNPNLAFAWYTSGWLEVFGGRPKIALKHLSHFKRMSPLDPLMPMAEAGEAYAHFYAGRYHEAASKAEQTLHAMPNLTPALRVAAAANALAGRIHLAQKMMTHLRQIDPSLRISNLKELTPLQRVEDIAKLAEGMRKAALPE